MAQTNNRPLSSEDISKIEEIVDTVADDCKHDDNLNPLHMFKGKLLPKTLIVVSCWITVCFGYYALTINATQVYHLLPTSLPYSLDLGL